MSPTIYALNLRDSVSLSHRIQQVVTYNNNLNFQNNIFQYNVSSDVFSVLCNQRMVRQLR